MSLTKQISDQYGFSVECTPMDELRTIIPTRLVGSTFVGDTLDTNFWTTTIAASGGTIATCVIGSGKALLSSKTDSTGSVILQSTRIARYIGGSANRYRSQIQFGDSGVANNTKRWGCFDGTNGAYFKLVGTALSVNTMKASSETSIASASWNGSTTTPTLTNCNSYEIYITNRKIYFVINGVLIHTEDTDSRAGAANDTWTASTNLPVRADNINSGNTTDTTMSIRVNTIYRLGNIETAPIYKNINTTAVTALILKRGAGRLHSVNFNTIPNTTIVSLYDALTATNPICIFNPPNGCTPFTMNFDLDFYTGLTVTTTPNEANITIIYE